MDLKSFYNGKTVLVTGNTGFKGSWMSMILDTLGARVVGIGLEPNTEPDIFSITGLRESMRTYYEDIRNTDEIIRIFKEEQPEVVIHMAAQPLVLESYRNPAYTYDVNVMGTVSVCEAVRLNDCVRSFVNVTTDKVYRNNEWEYPYRENDVLDGYDPYSNSKSCSELVTASYIRSFLSEKNVITSTCRAGNVIGGGDFSDNRIIPDCVRASSAGKPIEVRNPNSVRPYQHVLEAVSFYLMLAMRQYDEPHLAGSYNIGPGEEDCLTTGQLCDIFCSKWGDGAKWEASDVNGPHEANFLRLDTSKARSATGWKPIWRADEAVERTANWYKAYYAGKDMRAFSQSQISEYLDDAAR